MNKFFILTTLLGIFMFAAGGVLAEGTGSQSQNVTGTIDGVIDFSLNNLVFGSLTPNVQSTSESIITLNQPNTMDFTVDVSLSDSSAVEFQNLIFNLSAYSGDSKRIGDGTFQIPIHDTDTNAAGSVQYNHVPVYLTVPFGTLPGLRSGTIIYTVTGSTAGL